jgi:hypothetical protein
LKNTIDHRVAQDVAQNWEVGDTVTVNGNEFVTYTNHDVSILIDSDIHVVTM